MKAAARPRVKICCIASLDEAWLAIHAGVSALGLVSEMPSGPGVIPDDAIARIAAAVPPGVATFLLTSRRTARGVADQHRATRTSVIQIVDSLEEGRLCDIRAELPGIRLVQVVHVIGPGSVDEALAASEDADALLLDSGNPTLVVKQLGGTGRRHDWHLSREIRERSAVPVWLAGGLRPNNVAEAIAEVGPFGLDLCTGVRTDGKLDPARLTDFMQAVAEAASGASLSQGP